MSLLIEIAAKSVGVLVLVGLFAAVTRNHSAALRHRIWALGFVALAALPLLVLRLPEIRIEHPTTPRRQTLGSFASPPLTVSTTAATKSLPAQEPHVTTIQGQPLAEASARYVPAELLIPLWLLGALFFLLRTANQLRIALGWLAGGEDLEGGRIQGVPPHTRIVRTDKVEVPMTLGFLRPVILVPQSSTSWPEERMRAVLFHEGAHVQRGDWAWTIFAVLVSALYWPNPLVHLAAARMRVESELAADDAVLTAGLDARSYAATLVDLAENLRGRSMGAALPFVEAGSLKSRVAAILKGAIPRGPLARGVAIFALLLVVAVLTPFAAAHLVAGPEEIRDGVIDLGDGRHAEIVAITEMRGDQAVSWDIHGAVTRRTFPLSQQDLDYFRMMKPAPDNSKVRYVIFRVDDPNHGSRQSLSSAGDAFEERTYTNEMSGTTGTFQDALGGRYVVLQLVAPATAREASLKVKTPTDDWKLIAYKSFHRGKPQGLLNPGFEINLARSTDEHADGATASFLIPRELSDQELLVRFQPRPEAAVSRFIGVAGLNNATTTEPLDSITRVEILSRRLHESEFADLPLQPDPNSVYVPRHFLPNDIIVADRGKARLPDTSSIEIDSVSSPSVDGELRWDGNGNLLNGHGPSTGDSFLEKPRITDPEKRLVNLWMLRRPRDSRVGSQNLYDGEGWPLSNCRWMEVVPQGDYMYFNPLFDRTSHRVDLATQVPVGPFHRLALIKAESSSRSQWSFSKRLDGSGALRVEYPTEIAKQEEGMDTDVRPLDSKGNPVTEPNGSLSYSSGPGWLDFNVSRAVANRVTAVEILVRPEAWVKFPGVSLDPKGHP